MSAKIIKYILDCRKKGFSDEQIRKKLLETGYDAKIVDRFFKELEVGKIPKRWFPLLPALALILIIVILALSLRTGNELSVALAPVDSMTGQGCAVDAQQWSFLGRCTIAKTIVLPKRLQGKSLTMTIEASGTPLAFPPDWRLISTATFKEMGAKEFLEWDWANNPRNITLEMTTYDQRLNHTIRFTFEAGRWPEGSTPSLLAEYLNGMFQRIGTYDPNTTDYVLDILENVSLDDHSITVTELMTERYDAVWPIFNASVAGESHIVELTSGEWKSYQIQLQPQTESVTFTAHFLNDLFIPGVREDYLPDYAIKLQDRNLFIRKVLIREQEE